MPFLRSILLLALALCFFQTSAKGFELIGKKYSIDNGLQRMIFDLYQDSNNYLWVATARGLYRYNGRTFDHYALRDGLTDFLIYQLKEDQRGRIWGLTSTLRLFHFDPSLQDFTPYAYNDVLVDQVFHNHSFITCVDVDDSGSTYFGFEGKGKQGGLKISAKGEPSWLGAPPREDRVEIRNFEGGLSVSYSNHYLGKRPIRNTVLIRNGEDSLRVPFDSFPGEAAKMQLLPDGTAYNAVGKTVLVSRGAKLLHRWDFPHQVVQISIPRDSSVWVSTRSGTYKMGADGPLEKIYPGDVVTKVLVDHENAIWLAVLGGGALYAPKSTVQGVDLPGQNWPVSIHGLPDNSLLACTIDGFLIQIGDEGTGKRWDLPQRLMHLCPEGKNTFLATVNGDGIYRIQIEGEDFRYERIYAEQPEQEIDIVLHSKLAEVMVNDTSFAVSPHAIVKIPMGQAPLVFPAELPSLSGSLYRKAPNDYLIGTPHGLYRYTDSLLPQKEVHPLFNESIYQILPFGQDLLIPTFGKGIALWLPNDSIQVLNRDNGLSGDIVNGALVLNDTLAVVGTNNGVDWLIRRGGKVSSEPMLSNALYRLLDPQSFARNGDTLWIGHHSGLLRLLMSDLVRPTYTPELLLETAVVAGDTATLSDVYQVPYHNSSISLGFRSISFREEPQFFEYRIEGLDTNWRKTQEESIEFLSLPAGIHQVKIRRCNPSHPDLCAEIVVEVRVSPPIWQLWWFYLLGSLAVLGIGFGVFRRQHRKRLRAQALQNQLTQLELKSLRAQMNPHFIFNTINSIQHFILNHDVWEAQDYLARFGRLIRKTLESSRNELIPLSSEMVILQDYINLEKLRLDQPFEVEVEIDDELNSETFLIPPLLLQPVVENAIWHGLAHRNTPGTLKISFVMKEGYVDCMIEDNGIGRVANAKLQQDRHREGSSVGLDIIRERLDLFNDKLPESHFPFLQIKDLFSSKDQPCGTCVVIRLCTPS